MLTTKIDAALVRRLIETQFPAWAGLSVEPVSDGGWDNRTFRLGTQMLVRLPSAACYFAQIDKEQRWLPALAPGLTLAIPVPLALGSPGECYPWPWSVYLWIEGETAKTSRIDDRLEFASSLARFLVALQKEETTGGPTPGPHNFHRGGSLLIYDPDVRHAIEILGATPEARAAQDAWEAALSTRWQQSAVWVHGDIAPGNLLIGDGRLCAVIDFGNLGVGDPACDFAMAHTFFDGTVRRAFRSAVSSDDGTWARARGWALWKALIQATGISKGPSSDVDAARETLEKILA